VLRKAGFRTGLYLSPHVSDFRERMQIDGNLIPPEDLAGLTERVLPAAESITAHGVPVTEFELVTAIAMLWFAERGCDVAVLEVGLGGRFDATNVITRPLVSVIASISLDHTQILGDTLEKIAFEKCGIIKEGCPSVCYPDEPPEALAVIRHAARARHSALTEASGIHLKVLKSDLSGTEIESPEGRLFLPFLGEHQVKNAAAALAALRVLRENGWKIGRGDIAAGFSAARLPARLEVLSQTPPILLDGAHNPEGTAALASAIRRYLSGKKVVAVMGMMADKDVRKAVKNLAGVFSQVIAAAPVSARALSADRLADLWNQAGTPARAAANISDALVQAFSLLEPDGALIVCGSLYVAGDARNLLLDRLGRPRI
jgi:dihydrofolate synthase/folylpolyglutamate synthase